MYKRNEFAPDLMKKSVYKCKKDVECRQGTFTAGSNVVLLETCDGYQVFDFGSLIRATYDYYTYTLLLYPEPKDNIDWDSVDIESDKLSEYFERDEALSETLQNVRDTLSNHNMPMYACWLGLIIASAIFLFAIMSPVAVVLWAFLHIALAVIIFGHSARYTRKTLNERLPECFSTDIYGGYQNVSTS